MARTRSESASRTPSRRLPLTSESRPNVDVGSVDEPSKTCGIDVTTGPKLHVAPALAGSLQQASRVLQQRTKEEADVDVIFERVDVAERRVVDAGGRTTVVHQLAHVAATLPHAHEPGFDERSQIIALRAQPGIDCGVVFHRRWEAHDVVHRRPSDAR